MDEELERLVIAVRADTGGLARDVAAMRETLDGPLTAGAEQAGRAIENALGRAVRSGKLGFDDLKRVAMAALSDIAAAAVTRAVGGGTGGGLLGLAGTMLPSLLGLPGRATGGGVSAGRAYVVGERGPELFVPTTSGRIDVGRQGSGPVSISIHVAAPRDAGQPAMARTATQIARAVRRTLSEVEG